MRASLSELLGRALSQHLGIGVDYRATMMPDEMGIHVEIISPPQLRGFQFVFREGEPLPPQIMVARPNPTDRVRYTFNADPTQWVQVPGQIATIPGTAGTFTVESPTMHTRIEGVTVPTINETAIPATPAVGAVGVRTPEQEARLVALERMFHEVIMTQAQVEERLALRSMRPCVLVPPLTPQRRIRVRVIRGEYDNWEISVKIGGANKELPRVAIIKALLPPGEKHFIPNRQGRYRSSVRILGESLSAGLSAQSLHDALKAWALASETALTHAESDSLLADNSQLELLRAQPATLEVGGKVYKLVPCGEIDVRPLITRVRTRALATARVEGEAIRSRASTDARLVVSQAEQSAQAMRAAVEAERRRLGNPIPEWVKTSGRVHKWDGSNWSVQLMVSCKVDKIRLMVGAWERILWWNALTPKDDEWYSVHKMPVWLRLHPEGVYTINDVNMRGEWECVHIASYCCMELQGLPMAITNNDLAVRLENGLSRGMRVINLNSPLGVHTHKYWPDFKAQIPLTPLTFLESGRPSDSYLNPGRVGIEQWKALNPRIRWDSEESTRAEAEGVFTVREDSNAPIR